MFRILLITPMLLFLDLNSDPVRADEKIAGKSTRAAIERYLAEIDEIDRVAARRKEDAALRLKRTLDGATEFEEEQGMRYRGMLGSYHTMKGRIPFVMLSIPNGENVFSKYAVGVMNGKFDMSERFYKYEGFGHVVIPRSDVYYLEASRGHWDFELNDVAYNLGTHVAKNRYAAEVELPAGIYKVKFSAGNNGGQMGEASIRIVDKRTDKELPIFVYESELKKFWDDLRFGVELTETSKWTREKNRLD